MIEVFAGVAEHSVEKHAETPVFAFGEKYVEVGLVAEAGVDFKIVVDVVAVAVGGKNGDSEAALMCLVQQRSLTSLLVAVTGGGCLVLVLGWRATNPRG